MNGRYQQEMQTAQNRVGQPGAGMGSPQVLPPPQGAPQQSIPGGQPGQPGAVPQETPGFRDIMAQVETVLVQGKQGDLMIFGEFVARMQELAQGHQQQPGARPPAGGQPPMGGGAPPMQPQMR